MRTRELGHACFSRAFVETKTRNFFVTEFSVPFVSLRYYTFIRISHFV